MHLRRRCWRSINLSLTAFKTVPVPYMHLRRRCWRSISLPDRIQKLCQYLICICAGGVGEVFLLLTAFKTVPVPYMHLRRRCWRSISLTDRIQNCSSTLYASVPAVLAKYFSYWPHSKLFQYRYLICICAGGVGEVFLLLTAYETVPVPYMHLCRLRWRSISLTDRIRNLFQYLMCVCAAGVAEAATYPLDLTKTRYGVWSLPFAFS
jgi:hypothetical protein